MRVCNLVLTGNLAAAAGVVLFTFACAHSNSALAPVQFANVRDARQFMRQHGLNCHDGTCEVPTVVNSFFVADRPLTFEDTQAVSHRGKCGMTPAWKGIVWFGQIRGADNFGLMVDSVGGHSRVWGNVIVAGDDALMDHIESLYRNN
jgi:hypothetical protein